MLTSGTHAEAARFLTGSPSKEFKTNVETQEELWDKLTSAISNNNLITSACFIEN